MGALLKMLVPWTRPGALENSKRTHQAIRRALSKHVEIRKLGEYEVFLQGSYRNGTNIRGDSDVDVVVQLNVDVNAGALFPRSRSAPPRPTNMEIWSELRQRVGDAVVIAFGHENVTNARKCLKVDTPHLPADVVVALRFRMDPPRNLEGVAFYLGDEDRWVVNYPKRHFANGATKNTATESRFKQTVRLFKNARTYLIEQEILADGVAPSYFLECLLYNVPGRLFKPPVKDRFPRILGYLRTHDISLFVCQNRMVPLFGPSQEQWNEDDAETLLCWLGKLWEAMNE